MDRGESRGEKMKLAMEEEKAKKNQNEKTARSGRGILSSSSLQSSTSSSIYRDLELRLIV